MRREASMASNSRLTSTRLTWTPTPCMMTAVAGAVPWVLVSMLAAPAVSSPLPSNSTHTPSGRQTTPGARSSHRRTGTCAAPSALNSRT